jgi:hypothetical protein
MIGTAKSKLAAESLCSAWDAAPEGAVYIIERYRGNAVNLRTRFESLIKAAGLVPWPKPFQNLRASRETKLMAVFPAKEVASWLGNSEPAAMAHYAMATAESFQRAIGTTTTSGSISGSISRDTGAIPKETGPRKTPNLLMNPGLRWLQVGTVWTVQWARRDSKPTLAHSENTLELQPEANAEVVSQITALAAHMTPSQLKRWLLIGKSLSGLTKAPDAPPVDDSLSPEQVQEGARMIARIAER